MVDDEIGDDDGRPEWAKRLRRERLARKWSQEQTVQALRTFSNTALPSTLLDQYKRWERGRHRPDEYYRPLLAATFGTVVEALFPSDRPSFIPTSTDELLIARSGMDTHELVQRIRRSSLDNTTLDALSLTVEQLCCEYVTRDPSSLIYEARRWMQQITELLGTHLTFPQHRDLLDVAGWLTLLVGCLEYDLGLKRDAEATRVAALQLSADAGNIPVGGWAHEMRAWFALTEGRFTEVIEAAHAGQDLAPGRSVSVQLLAQEAKAWARVHDSRNVAKALEKGRELLDSLPYPGRPDNHFVVDPSKWDFYAMDCYRLVGDDTLAEAKAGEVIRLTTSPDGSTDLSPMRKAEAEITLGVVAARRGEYDLAREYGQKALTKKRVSGPSLLMVGAELDLELSMRDPNSPETKEFHNMLIRVTRSGA